MKIRILASMALISLTCAGSALAEVDSPAAPQTLEFSRRLNLAEQYLALENFEKSQEDVQSRFLRIAITICDNQECQADFNRILDVSVAHASHKFSESYARLLADKLTDAQLNAAIQFAKSPEGQALVKLEGQLGDQVAHMGSEAAAQTQQETMSNFCPSHMDVCAAFYKRSAAAGQQFSK